MYRKMRSISKIISILLLPILGLLIVPTAQSAPPSQGGSNLEVGIDLNQLNQIKQGIAQGEYDRPCTQAEHDRTKWHLLVNPELKCHYNHQHGDDPNLVNNVLGPPGEWFGESGQSISYPWQTFGAQSAHEPNDEYVANGKMENDLKHEGYGWVVRRNQPCNNGNCITDFRLQYHGVFGAMGAVVRYHSYSFEARVCANASNPSSCGIIRNGGWADFGRLFTTNGAIDCSHSVNENFVSLPADTLFFPIDRPEARDEIRCHPFLNSAPSYPSSKAVSEWWAHSPGDLIRFQLRSFDPLGNINPNNPSQWSLYCDPSNMNCRYNQSIMTAWIGYVLHIHEFMDGVRVDRNRDGRTDYEGFGDRWGGADNECTDVELDCVPIVYDNVLLNLFPNNGVSTQARYNHEICGNCPKVDYDLSPAGKKWITWFYSHAGVEDPNATPEPTPEPTDEPTPEPTDEPTPEPTDEPTPEPTDEPTPEPTDEPTPDPTSEPTPAEPEAITVDVHGPQTAAANETFSVNVDAHEVTGNGLYGTQVEINFDPAMVSISNLQVNPELSFVLMKSIDATTGKIKVVASRQNDAAGLTGNVPLFSFDATAAATSGDAPFTPENVKISDPQAEGFDVLTENLTVSIGDDATPEPTDEPTPEPTDEPTPEPTDEPTPEPTDEPTPEPTDEPTPEPTDEPTPEPTDEPTPEPTDEPTMADVAGQVIVAGRANNNWAGASVTVEYDGQIGGQETSMTNTGGDFWFDDLQTDVQATITADAPGYLPADCTMPAFVAPETTLLPVTLLSGDIIEDENVIVDITDAVAVGNSFDQSGSDLLADINLDGVVDIFDLVLVSINFGETGPQEWVCQ
jgi:cell division septation protein DedD